MDCYVNGCSPYYAHGAIGDMMDVYVTRLTPTGQYSSLISHVMVRAESCLYDVDMMLRTFGLIDVAAHVVRIEMWPHNARDERWALDGRSDPPPAVREAIERAYGERATEVFRELRYFAGDDFWGFTRHGMFVGVERDGYIHT